MTLQASARQVMAKKKLQRAIESAVVVQKHWRGNLSRRKSSKLKLEAQRASQSSLGGLSSSLRSLEGLSPTASSPSLPPPRGSKIRLPSSAGAELTGTIQTPERAFPQGLASPIRTLVSPIQKAVEPIEKAMQPIQALVQRGLSMGSSDKLKNKNQGKEPAL